MTVLHLFNVIENNKIVLKIINYLFIILSSGPPIKDNVW